MSYEKLLLDIGGAGRHQIMTLLLCSLVKAFGGAFTLLPALTSLDRPYTCESWSGNTSTWPQVSQNNSCSVDAGPESQTQICVSWNFSQTTFESTTQSQYQLTCEKEYLVELMVTVYFLGFTLGCPFYGRLADEFGRKLLLLVSAGNLFLASIIAPFAPWFWLYGFCRFAAGVGSGGLLTTLYTLNAEEADTKHRMVWCLMINMGWSLGIVAVPAVGYFVRNHAWLQVSLAAPFLIVMPIAGIFLKESARWLLAVGKYQRFHAAALIIAKRNRRTAPTTESLKQLYDDSLATIQANTGPGRVETSLLAVRHHKQLMRVLVIHWAAWFFVSCGYYMASFGVGLLGGNIFLSITLVGALEIPSRLVSLLLARCIGRVTITSLGFFIGACTCLASIMLLDAPHLREAMIAINLLGKVAFLMAFEFVWIYSAEIFPTPVRNSGIGWGSTWARVGAMTAPLLLLLRKLWAPAPYIVLGCGSLVISIATLWNPETMGRHSPETLAEGNKMATRSVIYSWCSFCRKKKEEEEEEEEEEKWQRWEREEKV